MSTIKQQAAVAGTPRTERKGSILASWLSPTDGTVKTTRKAIKGGAVEPDGDLICTFVVASANTTQFTEDRAVIPKVGALIRYDGKTYEVLTVSPQEPLLGGSLDEPAPQLSALVRVQLAK